MTMARKDYIEAARKRYVNDEVEVDDNAKISQGGDGTGTWVAAWLWVPTLQGRIE